MVTKGPRRRSSRLKAAPRDRFYWASRIRDDLLFTWPLLIHKRQVDIRLPERDEPNWKLQYEIRYGDGHYDARREMLNDALNDLLTRRGLVDFREIWKALDEARTATLLASNEGWNLDTLRIVQREYETVLANLKTWVARAHRLFRMKYSAHYTLADMAATLRPKSKEQREWRTALSMKKAEWKPALKLHDEDKPEIVRCLDELLAILDTDLFRIWATPTSGSLRRPRRGRPSQRKVLDEARQKLFHAGAPDETQDALLMAVGVIPYRAW